MSYLKTATLLALLALSSVIPVFAKPKLVEGYYIPRAGARKLKMTFLIHGRGRDFESMQTGMEYLDRGGKTMTLLPTEADEFGYIYRGDTVVMRSNYDNIVTQEDRFMHVLVDGTVAYYEYIRTKTVGSISNPTATHIKYYSLLQHSNGELVKIRDLFFRKDTTEFFADCPALVEKINKNECRTIAACARAYNRSCP